MSIETKSARLRAATAFAALIGWSALLLQLGLSLGMTLSDGRGIGAGLVAYLGYFTILTNLFAALTLTVPLLCGNTAMGRWFARSSVYTMVATAMAVVGIVYTLLLRQTWNPQGWQRAADMALHDVMPLLFLVCWWFAVPRGSLRWRQIPRWCLYPLTYFAYALARGALIGSYPYAFIDAGTLGYARVLVYALGLLCGYALIAAILVALKRNPTAAAARSA